MTKLPQEFSIGTYVDPSDRWWSYEANSGVWAQGTGAVDSLQKLVEKLSQLRPASPK